MSLFARPRQTAPVAHARHAASSPSFQFHPLESRLLMAARGPANDLFADAVPLRGVGAVVDGDNTGAKLQRGEDVPSESESASVWYSWKAPVSGGVYLELDPIFGDDFTGSVGVYRGRSVADLTEINYGFGFGDRQFIAKKGNTYWIAVYARDGKAGDFTLSLDAGLPEVTISARDDTARETARGRSPDTATLVVKRTGPTTHPLSVHYFVSDGSGDGEATVRKDFQGLPKIIRIPAGSKTATFSIVPIDDREVEPTERIGVSVSSSRSREYVETFSFVDVLLFDNDGPDAGRARSPLTRSNAAASNDGTQTFRRSNARFVGLFASRPPADLDWTSPGVEALLNSFARV